MTAELTERRDLREPSGSREPTDPQTAAAELGPALERLFGGEPPLRITFWDGT